MTFQVYYQYIWLELDKISNYKWKYIMLLGTKKGKQKENSVSLFFSSPSMTLNDLKVTISYFGKKNSIFFSALRDQKNK